MVFETVLFQHLNLSSGIQWHAGYVSFDVCVSGLLISMHDIMHDWKVVRKLITEFLFHEIPFLLVLAFAFKSLLICTQLL